MRLVQVFVPQGERELVVDALDRDRIEYALSEETGSGGFEAIVSIPVPPSGVELVLSSSRRPR